MNELITTQTNDTIDSQTLLNMVNESRKLCGEPEVRNNKFIEKILDELDGEHYTKSVVEKMNKTSMLVITMTYKQALRVAARESKAVRRSLIDKLEELQQQVVKPQLPDFTNPAEAARAWAAEYEQKLIAQEKLSIAAPKAEVYDRIVDRNNLYNATQVAQKFGQSAVWMNKQLEQFGVYNRSVKRGRVFQQWFIDKGYGIMRETETGHSQAMFYAEGEMWVIGKLTEEGLI